MNTFHAMTSLTRGVNRFHLLISYLAVRVTCINNKTSTNQRGQELNNTTVNTTSESSTSPQTTLANESFSIEKAQPYVIIGGVAILLLLLVCNFISVLQRRKYHRVIQRDFLTLNALLPFLRNYDEMDGPGLRRYSRGRKMSKDPTIEEYDEIGLFFRGSKQECKPASNVRNSLRTQDRNTVYSLQKEVLSTDF